MIQVVLFLALLTTGALSQMLVSQQCNQIFATPFVVNFTELLGTWHQVERIANENEVGECTTFTYTSVNDTLIRVSNREVVNQTAVFRNGTVLASNINPQSGMFVVDFDNSTSLDHYVLLTDLNNYGLLSACRNVNTTLAEVFSWKLSRSQSLDASNLTALNQFVLAHETLKNATWKKTSSDTNACHVSGGVTVYASPLLGLLTFLVVSKLRLF